MKKLSLKMPNSKQLAILSVSIIILSLCAVSYAFYAKAKHNNDLLVAEKNAQLKSNNQSGQSSTQNTTTDTTNTSQATDSTANTGSRTNSGSIKSPTGSTQTATAQSAPTLVSCSNSNDVLYESHSMYHNGAGAIQGANGWSKNCIYSDGHTTKETYVQPTSKYYFIYWYTPDSTLARSQCASYVGVSNTQAINECVDIATTVH